MPVAIFFSLLKNALINIIRGCQSSLTLIQSILQITYVLLTRLLDEELARLPPVVELSFELGLLVQVELDAKTMFESIEELAVVQPAIVEIEKSLVSLVFDDGITIVDAILELFDRRRSDDDIAAHAEIGEKLENLRRISPQYYPLLLAIINHYLFCNIPYLLPTLCLRLREDLVPYVLADDLTGFLVELGGVHHETRLDGSLEGEGLELALR